MSFDPNYVATIEEIVDAITNDNVTWAIGRAEITYSLAGLEENYRKDLAVAAFKAWSDIIDVTFVEVTSNENADIVFSLTNPQFHGTPPNPTTQSPGVINVPDFVLQGSFVPVSNTMVSLMHEIGHVLGFRHPVTYGSGAVYDEDRAFANDTRQFTILSYFEQSNYEGATTLPPTTLQMADIKAAIDRYGANDARPGNDVYGFNTSTSTAGSVYDFTYYQGDANPFHYQPGFVIYDTGGIDVFDVSGFSNDQIIDLRPGTWSNIGGNVQNIGIYLTSWIENAIGGSGNDTITGNDLNNVLDGGAGSDAMAGGKGSDTYYVDDTSDVICEKLNAGTDKVLSSVSFVLGSNIENLELISSAAIDGTGNSLANEIIGNNARNNLNGGIGDDTLYGRDGDDYLAGAAGNDTLRGENGADLLIGGDGIDLLYGGNGDDHLLGGMGNDSLLGGAGNDILRGGLGNDSLWGHAGADVFRFDSEINGLPNIDQILDFTVNEDQIQLEDSVFTALGSTGPLAQDAFQIGTTAEDADDRILYDSATGHLSYDPDGNGAMTAIWFATLTNSSSLSADDIFVI
ncbi:M10 family metallopeptidase C-terminal domain-containing protein [Halomonas sp. IOP_14]|uniref:M10 family metallopeptidase C-terminal domain-containing protein n=1 Tax=Halomonas sp. IOP_14 TaxID=2873295 RepID=UPI001E474030|nr:M10 family metallopeptidase C-terminal domain-containing protein [Halomonas sp. IOP_14]MCD1585912.1 M10 family metallopeptidase C-terminal domain-containing protein [Halomonas sp. IOP_14]